MDDLISRQAAIDALKHAWAKGLEPTQYLEELPSAQPEWNNHTVACLLAELFDDTCACNHNGMDEWLPEKCELLDSCPDPGGVACWEQFLKYKRKGEPMSDLISRQAAIDVAVQSIKDWDGMFIQEANCRIRDAINDLPSAQPEQKTGKWINKEICLTKQKEEMQVARCSNCKKYLTTPHIYSFNHYRFCPNCGARMEVIN